MKRNLDAIRLYGSGMPLFTPTGSVVMFDNGALNLQAMLDQKWPTDTTDYDFIYNQDLVDHEQFKANCLKNSVESKLSNYCNGFSIKLSYNKEDSRFINLIPIPILRMSNWLWTTIVMSTTVKKETILTKRDRVAMFEQLLALHGTFISEEDMFTLDYQQELSEKIWQSLSDDMFDELFSKAVQLMKLL